MSAWSYCKSCQAAQGMPSVSEAIIGDRECTKCGKVAALHRSERMGVLEEWLENNKAH